MSAGKRFSKWISTSQSAGYRPVPSAEALWLGQGLEQRPSLEVTNHALRAHRDRQRSILWTLGLLLILLISGSHLVMTLVKVSGLSSQFAVALQLGAGLSVFLNSLLIAITYKDWKQTGALLSLSEAPNMSQQADLEAIHRYARLPYGVEIPVQEQASRYDENAGILEQYQALAVKHILNEAEQQEFDRLDKLLIEIEHQKAEDFNRDFASSRAGKLEAALDRLEGYVQALTTTEKK